MEEKENFEEYMQYFKSLSLKEKQSIIFDQLKYLATLTNSFCKEINVQNDMVLHKEIADLFKDNYTEDDFAEAIIVLINSIQESISDYVIGISNITDSLVGDSC